MATKRKATAKRSKVPSVETPKASVPEEKPAKPQFVTEVVEEEMPAPSLSEVPVNEGVDVPKEALETIKEKAEEIEEVVEEIQEEKKETVEPDDGETEPVDEVKKEEKKELLEEIFSKESSLPTVYPDISEHKRMGAAPVFLWAVIIIGVALLTGGTLLVVASGLPKLPTLLSKPTPTPTPAPTPIPTPAAPTRSDIKLQVLNGGGTPGSAGKAKTFLEEKGYSVADTGNTDEYTYKKTEIHVKVGKEAYLEFLKKDLAEDYTVGSASADLASDVAYDAQVIVGKK